MKKESKKIPVYANFRSYCEITREANYDDEWDRDDTCYTWDFKNVTLQRDYAGYIDKSEEVYVDQKLIEANDTYLVYAVYSTGDSFGNDENACLECIGIYSKEDAYKIKELIELDCKEKPGFDSKNNYIIYKDQKIYTYQWKGYFESLSYIEVEKVEIT